VHSLVLARLGHSAWPSRSMLGTVLTSAHVAECAGAAMRPARIAYLTMFCAVLMMGTAIGNTAAARPDPDASEKKGKPVKKKPTKKPTHKKVPTRKPTRKPTKKPTTTPTKAPTPAPTAAPIADFLVQGQSAFETARPKDPTPLAPTTAGPYAIAHRGSSGSRLIQTFCLALWCRMMSVNVPQIQCWYERK